jgi:hypothetical protein
MKINPKSKKFLVGMVLLIFVNAFMCWWCLGTLIHARETRSIANQLDAAVTQLQKGPQGAESAERFLAALKQIDAGYAPSQVKVALRDYITATERDLLELKAGRRATQADEDMARAQENLIQSLRSNH